MIQAVVYIMASGRNGTLYTGVTSGLMQSASQHRERLLPGFTAQFECTMLVWFECHQTMASALDREKQIREASRRSKLELIETRNPAWRDLFCDLM